MPLNSSLLRSLRGNTTQADFAKLAGLTQPDVARYENSRRVPTVATLEKLARACSETSGRRVTVAELLKS